MSIFKRSANGCCEILAADQWQLVRRMRLEALGEAPQAFLGSYQAEAGHQPEDWLRTFESASWHGFFTLAWGRERRIVGIAKSSILPEHPDERYVESFWIRPEHRHLHIARLILGSILDEARNEGRDYLRLSVLRTNSEARETLRHLGFETVVPDRTTSEEFCLERAISG